MINKIINPFESVIVDLAKYYKYLSNHGSLDHQTLLHDNVNTLQWIDT